MNGGAVSNGKDGPWAHVIPKEPVSEPRVGCAVHHCKMPIDQDKIVHIHWWSVGTMALHLLTKWQDEHHQSFRLVNQTSALTTTLV